MAVVIASTTASQEELDHAVSKDWRTPPEVKTEAPIEEVPEGQEASPETADAQGAPKTEEKKGKGGWQKRVDALTARNKALEERLARIEAREPRADNLSAEKTPASPPIDTSARPKQADFQSTDDYVAAMTRWTMAQDAKEKESKAAQERTQQLFDSYNERLETIREKYEDWDEVSDSLANTPIPNSVHAAIISMGDPELAFQLAKHPEEVEKLWNIVEERGDGAAVAELGAIRARFIPSTTNPQTPKAKTAPPPPIRPVRGTVTQSPPSIYSPDISDADYIRMRNKQARERGRH